MQETIPKGSWPCSQRIYRTCWLPHASTRTSCWLRRSNCCCLRLCLCCRPRSPPLHCNAIHIVSHPVCTCRLSARSVSTMNNPVAAQDVLAALQKALTFGLQYEPMAGIAVTALELWERERPQVLLCTATWWWRLLA
jgi:hypothetical protein